MAARPPLLACLAVAGVVRNPKLRWTVGFSFWSGTRRLFGISVEKINTADLMEIVGGLTINNNTCWHIGEGTCFNGCFKLFFGAQNSFSRRNQMICLELGVCSKERVDVGFLQYVDTSVHALNVHVVFFFSLAIHRHGLKLCILLVECFGSLN